MTEAGTAAAADAAEVDGWDELTLGVVVGWRERAIAIVAAEFATEVHPVESAAVAAIASHSEQFQPMQKKCRFPHP